MVPRGPGGSLTVAETWLAPGVVLATGLYLIGLCLAALMWPTRTRQFLTAFASSAATHYTEVAIRFVLGAAFIVAAPRMQFSAAFVVFGWMLVGTTVVLMLIPWTWHRRFAEWSLPHALKSLLVIAVPSGAGGLFILYALVG